MGFEIPTLFVATLMHWQSVMPPIETVPSSGNASGSFWWMLWQTLLALSLVCALAYLIFRWVLPRLDIARSANSMVRIVDVVALDARKRLYIIEVTGRWLLIASSETGVQLISELDSATAKEAAEAMAHARPAWKTLSTKARGTFADRFAHIINRRR